MLSCPICSDVSNGMHYGVATCESCKSFFRRTLQANKHETYVCRYKRRKKPCAISVETRSFCKLCRYNRLHGAALQLVAGGERHHHPRRLQVQEKIQTHQPKTGDTLGM